MDSEPSAVTLAKCITKSDDIDWTAVVPGGDYLPRGDGDGRSGEGNCQMLEVHRGGRRLRCGAEAGEPLCARLDNAVGADTDKIGSEETGGFRRGPGVKPLVFDMEDGLRRRLRGGAGQHPHCEEKADDERLESQILMKIFLR